MSLSRLDILRLAQVGAHTNRGVAQGLSPEEWAALDAQVAEITRLIEKEKRRLTHVFEQQIIKEAKYQKAVEVLNPDPTKPKWPFS